MIAILNKEDNANDENIEVWASKLSLSRLKLAIKYEQKMVRIFGFYVEVFQSIIFSLSHINTVNSCWLRLVSLLLIWVLIIKKLWTKIPIFNAFQSFTDMARRHSNKATTRLELELFRLWSFDFVMACFINLLHCGLFFIRFLEAFPSKEKQLEIILFTVSKHSKRHLLNLWYAFKKQKRTLFDHRTTRHASNAERPCKEKIHKRTGDTQYSTKCFCLREQQLF